VRGFPRPRPAQQHGAGFSSRSAARRALIPRSERYSLKNLGEGRHVLWCPDPPGWSCEGNAGRPGLATTRTGYKARVIHAPDPPHRTGERGHLSPSPPRPRNHIVSQQINVEVASQYRADCAIEKFGTVNRNLRPNVLSGPALDFRGAYNFRHATGRSLVRHRRTTPN
jgi:hypothetical protein